MNQQLEQGQTLLARQPIFDRQLKVIAYELLYRKDDDETAAFLSGDQATSEVLLNTYTSICDQGTNKRVPAFINLTRDLLLNQQVPRILSKQLVLEILEDVIIDQPLIDAVRQLKADGFRLALDDFVYDSRFDPLLDLVDIVKIDIQQLNDEQLKEHITLLKRFRVTLLAEKIETVEQLYACVDLGFKLFQGHFLSKPQVVKGRKVAANSVAILQVIQALQDPAITAGELEGLVLKDPVLTYKLLRIVNSAAYSLVREVQSLRQAIVLLGLEQIRKWATLIALNTAGNKPEELSRSLLARGRMCELLAESMGYTGPSRYFMVGMMSEINALLDIEMDALLEQIPLSAEVKSAITQRDGQLGEVLSAVMAYELGEWDQLSSFSISDQLYESAYRHSLVWAQEAMQVLAEEQ